MQSGDGEHEESGDVVSSAPTEPVAAPQISLVSSSSDDSDNQTLDKRRRRCVKGSRACHDLYPPRTESSVRGASGASKRKRRAKGRRQGGAGAAASAGGAGAGASAFGEESVPVRKFLKTKSGEGYKTCSTTCLAVTGSPVLFSHLFCRYIPPRGSHQYVYVLGDKCATNGCWNARVAGVRPGFADSILERTDNSRQLMDRVRVLLRAGLAGRPAMGGAPPPPSTPATFRPPPDDERVTGGYRRQRTPSDSGRRVRQATAATRRDPQDAQDPQDPQDPQDAQDLTID
ncbi:hypothetical protein CYMTET_47260 [Cymbomonas tetramitiformis]|uniref:Uncharacterized protein n=1 Tax=Cymbomonas tetramitiformis TaxID=36881 RepID=A0AAE0BUJ7_9CHLO|nr:hypothetical protein CYMTET_47260 [Cymbomonas tetramitiformis]